MNRIPFDEVQQTLAAVLSKLGFSPDRADICARLFAETTRDGVYTMASTAFRDSWPPSAMAASIPRPEPEVIARFGALERWDGHCGPGNLNALAAMDRATALGREHGIGCVALANTNHWMRAGTYGWQAADAGLIGICWTNTMANLPPWGGAERVIGNNPLVIAVPRPAGHVVLDIAMSQFSYGTLESYKRRGELLPFDGGFDTEGNLTRDPAAIEQSWRPLPIGYWKGSGLSVMLDVVAAMMSLGQATHQIPADPLLETAVSQMFVTMNPEAFGPTLRPAQIADGVVASLKNCPTAAHHAAVRYPGEQTLHLRAENRSSACRLSRPSGTRF